MVEINSINMGCLFSRKDDEHDLEIPREPIQQAEQLGKAAPVQINTSAKLVVLREETLLSESTQAIEVHTKTNDIQALSKEEIRRLAAAIERRPRHKAPKEPSKLLIDPNLINQAIIAV